MGAFGHAKGLRDAVQFELATDRQVAVEPCIYGQTKEEILLPERQIFDARALLITFIY